MDGGMILLYHRVADLTLDPQFLSIPPIDFSRHIRYLKSRFKIVSLASLVESLSDNSNLNNVLVLTFDDGYFDLFYEVKPVLEKEKVHATIFITAGMIGSPREFWWDELERIFLTDEQRIPNKLLLSIDGQHSDWDTSLPSSRLQAYKAIHRLLRNLCHSKREKAIDDIFFWADLDRNRGRSSHRPLSREELHQLARSEFISIGSHTLSHSILSAESHSRQEIEIEQSRNLLKQWTGREVISFSYPFGSATDFNSESVHLVKKHQYKNAVTAVSANINPRSDPYQLPRRLIRKWPFFDFRRQIDKYACDYSGIEKQSELVGANREGRIKLYLDRFRQMNDFKKAEWSGARDGSFPGSVRNVLQINTHDCLGGAAKVAGVIGEMLVESGRNSYMLVKYKLGSDERILELEHEDGIDDCQLKAFLEARGWQDIYHPSAFQLLNHPFFLAADSLCLHNLHGNYFTPLILPVISKIKPVIWILHDMQAISGHCAHSFACTRWEKGCYKCENLRIPPQIQKDLASLNLKIKDLAYKGSDLTLVCPSKWLRDKVRRSIMAGFQTFLIPNGIDENVFFNHEKSQAREKLYLPQNKPIILFVAVKGRDNIWKGGKFLQAIQQRLDCPDAIFFVVGDQHPSLPNGISRGEIEDERELALVYSSADLLVYPSLADNFPFVVLESLSCGTPVVAFQTGGIPEIISHKKNGYLAKYEDLDDLVSGMRYYLRDAKKRKNASEHSRRSILRQFTSRQAKAKYNELIEIVHRKFHACHRRNKPYVYDEIKRVISDTLVGR
jgi:glycosyltransferase involved in cell wall biosynthesis